VPLQFYINIMRIIPDSEMTAQYEITGGGGVSGPTAAKATFCALLVLNDLLGRFIRVRICVTHSVLDDMGVMKLLNTASYMEMTSCT